MLFSSMQKPIASWRIVSGGGTSAVFQPYRKGSRTVSDRSKSAGLACPRCKTKMDEVVRIAPLAGEPGLIGYECPACFYVTSVLIQPKERDSQAQR